MGIGLRSNVGHGLINFVKPSANFYTDLGNTLTAVNSVGLFIWDLDAKLFLNCHHNLNSIKAV